MMDNNKQEFSLAENKYRWKGVGGMFDKNEIAPWHQIYNQTTINDLEQLGSGNSIVNLANKKINQFKEKVEMKKEEIKEEAERRVERILSPKEPELRVRRN